jgi:hypothetical protein
VIVYKQADRKYVRCEMERNYVIASTKHMTGGFLEFWGRYTRRPSSAERGEK